MPKIIIYLIKTKEPIQVIYSVNVTVVKHKYDILIFSYIIGKIAHDQDAEEFQ